MAEIVTHKYVSPRRAVTGRRNRRGGMDKKRAGVPFEPGHGQSKWEAWWLNGSAPDCNTSFPGSNLTSPQPIGECQSPGGLPPGIALGCRLTSVRGTEEKITKNKPLISQKHIKKKKQINRGIAGLCRIGTRKCSICIDSNTQFVCA